MALIEMPCIICNELASTKIVVENQSAKLPMRLINEPACATCIPMLERAGEHILNHLLQERRRLMQLLVDRMRDDRAMLDQAKELLEGSLDDAALEADTGNEYRPASPKHGFLG